eukprot:scaffold25161_cov118-Isochrysis_galbana.AAC.1
MRGLPLYLNRARASARVHRHRRMMARLHAWCDDEMGELVLRAFWEVGPTRETTERSRPDWAIPFHRLDT